MMKKQFIILATAVFLLSACSSGVDENDFSRLESKVATLEGRLARSNEDLVTTKSELDVVKKQRVIRLPTGAPLEMRARNDETTPEAAVPEAAVPEAAPATPEAVAEPVADEGTMFKKAIEEYKNGDIKNAVSSLEKFVSTYPNSKHIGEASYYLGQASYTTRDFTRAQQILEPLVFQPTNGKVNQSIARLLKVVYQAQENSEDAEKLDKYLHSFSKPKVANNELPVAKTIPLDANTKPDEAKSEKAKSEAMRPASTKE